MTKVGQWFRKHESPSGQAAPFRDSSLQRPYLPDGEVTGGSPRSRSKSSLAVRSGSDLSQVTTRGHVASKGSLRVRQCRGGLGPERCVGRTSPSPRRAPNFSKSDRDPHRGTQHVNALPRGESGEMVVDRSNFIDQPQGIPRAKDRS